MTIVSVAMGCKVGVGGGRSLDLGQIEPWRRLDIELQRRCARRRQIRREGMVAVCGHGRCLRLIWIKRP